MLKIINFPEKCCSINVDNAVYIEKGTNVSYLICDNNSDLHQTKVTPIPSDIITFEELIDKVPFRNFLKFKNYAIAKKYKSRIINKAVVYSYEKICDIKDINYVMKILEKDGSVTYSFEVNNNRDTEINSYEGANEALEEMLKNNELLRVKCSEEKTAYIKKENIQSLSGHIVNGKGRTYKVIIRLKNEINITVVCNSEDDVNLRYSMLLVELNDNFEEKMNSTNDIYNELISFMNDEKTKIENKMSNLVDKEKSEQMIKKISEEIKEVNDFYDRLIDSFDDDSLEKMKQLSNCTKDFIKSSFN